MASGPIVFRSHYQPKSWALANSNCDYLVSRVSGAGELIWRTPRNTNARQDRVIECAFGCLPKSRYLSSRSMRHRKDQFSRERSGEWRGDHWQCVFANDFDFRKGVAYQSNWDKNGQTVLKVGDIRKIETSELPGTTDLACASLSCQDLSLTGGVGLSGERSGTFYPFWNIIKLLIAESRAPRVVALTNVTGTLSSHGGKDFAWHRNVNRAAIGLCDSAA